MKKICLFLFLLPGTLALAQGAARTTGNDRPVPQLISKKTNKPLEVKRQPAFRLKLVNKKDKAKVIDFSIEHINTGKLEILQQWTNFSDKVLEVTVKNNGPLPSKQAYIAIMIGAYFGPLLGMGAALSPENVYTSGQVVAPLKQGESRKYVFDITEAYALIWGAALSKKMENPYGYAVLLTEPIVIE